MIGKLDNYEFPIACPKCGAKIYKTKTWLKTHAGLECPCGTSIYLDTTDVVRLIDELDVALSKIERSAPGTGAHAF